MSHSHTSFLCGQSGLLLERRVVVSDVVTSQIPLVLDRLVAEVALQFLALLVHVLDVLKKKERNLIKT